MSGPSVLDGQLRYISVSQLEKFDPESYGGCERRWWFRYISHAKEPQMRHQKLGEQVHSQIEHYLRTGEDVLGDIARAGKHFLPRPGRDLLIEYPLGEVYEHLPGGSHGPIVSPLTIAEVPVVGRVDLLHCRGEWVKEDGETCRQPNTAEIIDWKTTKQIDDDVDEELGVVLSKGYAKSGEQLANTHQMVGYAELARRMWPDIKSVVLSHGYFQTKGKKVAAKRSSIITVDEVTRRLHRSEQIVERMKSVARVEDIKTVAPNYSACAAYGGCPHRQICPREPMLALKAAFEGKMSLAGKWKKPAQVKPEVVAELEVLKAEEKALGVEAMDATEAIAITPPDMPEPKKVAEGPACVTGVEGSKSLCGTCDLSDEAPPAAEPAEEPAKKKRTKKTEKEKINLDAVLEVSPEGEMKEGLALFLDASQDGIRAKRLETFAEELAARLAEEYKAADIRCAPEPLAFGKWKGALAALARAEVPAGYYECSSSSELGMVVFEAIAPKATRIVRGRR